MTPNQYAETIEWLEDRWPGTKIYRNAEAMFVDFAHLPHEAFRAAAKQLYHGGRRTAPTFSELEKATRENLGRFIDDTDPTLVDCERRGHHGHLGILSDAMVDPPPNAPAGYRDTLAAPPEHRVAICSDCGAEITKPAAQLVTDAERRAGEGRREPPPGADRSDTIAR